MLASASVNKPSDTVHNGTSWWTDKEIQRGSHDVQFSVVKASKRGAANFLLDTGGAGGLVNGT
jgi:hypothetical protein